MLKHVMLENVLSYVKIGKYVKTLEKPEHIWTEQAIVYSPLQFKKKNNLCQNYKII